MNDLEKLQLLADPGTLKVMPSEGNLGTFKVYCAIKGVTIGGQFDITNVGLYAIEIGDIDSLTKLIQPVSAPAVPTQSE